MGEAERQEQRQGGWGGSREVEMRASRWVKGWEARRVKKESRKVEGGDSRKIGVGWGVWWGVGMAMDETQGLKSLGCICDLFPGCKTVLRRL
jgi:hypothetical protein